VKPLALLERLAAQEVERERQALAALDETLERRQRDLAGELAAAAQERRAADDLADAALYARWLAGSRQRQERARREVERLEQARAEQTTRLIERRLARKRLEVLRARAEQRHAADMRRREQRQADEVAVMRAAQRGRG